MERTHETLVQRRIPPGELQHFAGQQVHHSAMPAQCTGCRFRVDVDGQQRCRKIQVRSDLRVLGSHKKDDVSMPICGEVNPFSDCSHFEAQPRSPWLAWLKRVLFG